MHQPIVNTDVGFDNSSARDDVNDRVNDEGAVVDPELRKILVSVASHYGCSLVVLALRQKMSLHAVGLCSDGRLVFEKTFPLKDEEKFQLFHHHMDRSLPTIIYDAAKDPRLQKDPCVQEDPCVRFYAAAPIFSPSRECKGTLCIVDSRPKNSFSVEEAAYLCDQAAAVASLV
eukprot:TRINITY_DN20520_c0_g1_i2.p1 TRINITY_DN20520_c0_g1~~TRINITY_DN20520_c0_g1_i2.p1  ORF type:complete len:173 (-),score=22.27 TRINITY_DN20520_c0_g1_i2:213-731(-)